MLAFYWWTNLLAALKPSVSQIGGSSKGEVLLWQMPAAPAWIAWIVHLAAYNCITWHGTASLSACLPHPTSLLPFYFGSESAAVTPISSANVGRVSLHCLLRIVLQKCGCCPDVCSCLILYFCLDLLISFLLLLFCLFYFLSQEFCCFFGLWSLFFSCRASLSVCPLQGLHQAANRLSSW